MAQLHITSIQEVYYGSHLHQIYVLDGVKQKDSGLYGFGHLLLHLTRYEHIENI